MRTAKLVRGLWIGFVAGSLILSGGTSYAQDGDQELKEQVTNQQKQIEELRKALEEERQLLRTVLEKVEAQSAHTSALKPADTVDVASAVPMAPSRAGVASPASGPAAAVSPEALNAVQGQLATVAASTLQVQEYTQKVDTLGKKLDEVSKGLGGFKFSGDLRFRTDAILRSANSEAGPQQNVRERYRVRLNVNKEVTDQFGFHVQLGTGTSNNPTTYDSDFNGSDTRGFLWLTEYHGDYHPNKNFGLRAGRMAEVFADDSKFLFDDDIRFNGLQEIAKAQISEGASVEFRAGQYIFTNPNKQILPSAAACASATPPADCVFVEAGFAPGGKVRASNLFHQGVVLHAETGSQVKHTIYADYQHFRNPTQFLIASSSSRGVPVLVNGFTGLTLSGGVGQLGNGTTTPGGFMYTADSYHVGHLGYRVDLAGWKTSRQSWPLWIDLQVARNFGASFLNNAEMAAISLGSVKKGGDLRFLYGYYVKESNSMIAQLTDDDIGTGVSTNVRTHYIRVDLGLTSHLQWQNLLYIQNQISASDPTRDFFVAGPPPGANTQYRIHSQLAISF